MCYAQCRPADISRLLLSRHSSATSIFLFTSHGAQATNHLVHA
jgi:hypothetical protein